MPSLAKVFDALGDVIRQQQQQQGSHEPTATEYFALICSTLGASTAVTEHTQQLLEILEGVTLQSSPVIVRSQFRTLSAGLLQILGSSSSSSGNDKLTRTCVVVLGQVLQKQETSEGLWNGLEALQAVNALLSFIDDARIRIRRAAQDQLLALMSQHARQGGAGVVGLRSYVADFSLQIMQHCTRSGYRRALHVLLFLERGAVYLPAEQGQLLRVVEGALRLEQCEQPLLEVGFEPGEVLHTRVLVQTGRNLRVGLPALLRNLIAAHVDVRLGCKHVPDLGEEGAEHRVGLVQRRVEGTKVGWRARLDVVALREHAERAPASAHVARRVKLRNHPHAAQHRVFDDLPNGRDRVDVLGAEGTVETHLWQHDGLVRETYFVHDVPV